MAEILTESFCERCGTRYTFQSAAPKVGRLAKMKVLSRGLKNYVLSDETTLDEALADARSVDDREQSVEQLDAFHKTFNFCMSCRQYTCANCWNDREGRCFSCAPSLSVGVLPSAHPSLDPITGIGRLGLAGNGHDQGDGSADPLALDASAWPEADLANGPDASDAEDKPVSRLEAIFGRKAATKIESATRGTGDGAQKTIGLSEVHPEASKPKAAEVEASPKVEPAPKVEPPPKVEAVTAAGPALKDAAMSALGEPEVVAELASVKPTDEPGVSTDEAIAATAATTEERDEATPAAAELAPGPVTVHPVDPETDDLAAAAAAQTHGLLDKFRARPEAMPAARPTVADGSRPIEPRPFVPTQPAPAYSVPQAPIAPALPQMPYAAVGPQPAPTAPAVQPYGLGVAPPRSAPTPPPYAGPAAMPYAGQTPQPYAPPSAQPYATPAIPVQPYPAPTSPYATPPAAGYPPYQPQYAAPQPQYAPPPPQPPAPSWRMVAPESPLVAPPASNNGHLYPPGQPPAAPEPQWPAAPAWPAAPLGRTRGAEAVWAESTRDLLSRPETGVSACFSCGLPLSATARFCRRCGTSQVTS